MQTNVLETPQKSSKPPIKAYAKLSGPNLSYYMQTLTLSIGRDSLSSQFPNFLPISPSKKVSKLQAEIKWNPKLLSFQITNKGHNKILVNRTQLPEGYSMIIGHKSAIKIDSVCFYFILPERPN